TFLFPEGLELLMRRTLTGGVAVFAAACLALSGCSPKTDAGGTAAPSSAPAETKLDPSALLPQSLKNIKNDSFKFTSTTEVNGETITTTGAFDLANKRGTMTLEMGDLGSPIEIRVIGDDMYMSGYPGVDGWVYMDLSEITGGNTFADAANPVANADFLLAASDDVKEVGDGKYEGTLDMKKYLDEYATEEQKQQLAEALEAAGPDAMKVPFTATV